MEYRSSEVKAGFFIFLGMVTLIVFVFMLGDVKNLLDEKKDLTLIFDYTSGLQVGATVRYAGLDVGRVKSISLSTQPKDKGSDLIAVETEIDPRIHIKDNARATIKTEGLMGAFMIDIRPGGRKGKPLGPNEPLMGMESFEFTKVGDMAGEVVGQIKRFTDLTEDLILDTRETLEGVRVSLANVDRILTENKGHAKNTFRNLENISAKLDTTLKETGADLKATLKNTRSITEKTDHILTNKQQEVEDIIHQTDELTKELNKFMTDTRPALTNLIQDVNKESHEITQNLNSATISFDETMQQSNAMLVENRRHVLETMRNMKTLTANLKALSEDLKRNPWKVVWKEDEQKADSTVQYDPNRKDKLRMKRVDKVPE